MVEGRPRASSSPLARGKFVPVVAVLFTAAAWEEICFRGLPFAVAPPGLVSLALTTAISSIAFSVQHLRGGRRAVVASFVFGIAFSVLYFVTADLPAVIVAHALSNIIVLARWRPEIGVFERGKSIGVSHDEIANLM